MGLLALRSIVCARPAETSGSPHPPTWLISSPPAVFLRTPSPISCEMGSSSRELSLPYRVLPTRARPVAAGRRSSFHGVPFPLRDIGRRRPLMRGSQVPHRSVHDVSHVLDGLLRHRLCRLVSSRSHVQGSLSRGFPPDAAVPPRRRPVPSCRWPRRAARRLPAVRHAPSPDFRACSAPGSVAPPAGFSRERRPIPS